MKKLSLLLGLAAAVVATQASAVPFDLGGFTGPVVIKFSDFENVDTAAAGGGPLTPSGVSCPTISLGCINYGVVNITSITTATSVPLWLPGVASVGGGGFISGIFSPLAVTSTSGAAPNLNVNSSTIFEIDLYLNPAASNPALGSAGYTNAGCPGGTLGGSCYDTISNQAGGILLLKLEAVPGANLAGDTLVATFTTDAIPTTGAVNSLYLNVIGGSAATMFDSDGQVTALGTAADIFFKNTFCPNVSTCSGPVGDWFQLSNDPANARVVPEPAMVGLLGIALLGIGVLRRRAK